MKLIDQDALIKLYRDYFHFREMKWPDEARDAVDFAVIKIGEVVDALKRGEKGWLRHNERETDLGMEISQAIMMLFLAANAADINVQEATFGWMRAKGKEIVFEPEYFIGEDYNLWARPTIYANNWHVWGKFDSHVQSACGLEFPTDREFEDQSGPNPRFGVSTCSTCNNYYQSRRIVKRRSWYERAKVFFGKD